ncbi:MAG: aldehyde dehydrogenase family protein [Deltaproteobacteria bacterium]|nr:aldehyde dehydrogenase family protein [Deltaproteobacteria bacterium]
MTEDIKETFRKQRSHQPVVKLSIVEERIEKLKRLREALIARTPELKKAIYADYRKSPTEVDLTEVYPCIVEINHAIRNLKSWMAPARVSTPRSLFGTRSEVRYEPKGVVLIIGPWNYPFSLVINPLVSAIAAGNCAIIKPSELTQNTSRFLKDFVGKLFKDKEVAVFEGDVSVTTALLTLPFDHIFFTGSPRVGKIVMEAASKNLSSVTLELGGKSPVIIDESADLAKAADRLTVAKFINAGQTCVAPDYIYVHEKMQGELVTQLKAAIANRYGSNPEDRRKNPDYCRVINSRNFSRLSQVLDESVKAGAKIEIGGERNESERYISPTVLTNVTVESPIMREEIFGPLLPVLTYRSLEDVYRYLRAQGEEKPLALYIFSEDRGRTEELLLNTTAGGTCVNQAILHLANPNLPFGGTGHSGVGSYHGVFGFRAFSHERAVLRQGRIDTFKMLYPPYTDKVVKMIERVTRYLS